MSHRPLPKESQSSFLILSGTPSTTEERPICIPISSGRVEIVHLKGDWREVSSVQRLPPEMLSEIFLFYHAMRADSYRALRIPSPLILCHVCSVWRRVAQTTPKLWTSISLKFQTGTFGDHVSLASAWLERARPYPVSVTLNSYSFGSRVPPRIVECILPSAGRLRSLHLVLPITSLKPLVDIHPGSMILLEHVHLHVMPAQSSKPKHLRLGPIIAFKTAPRLRTFILTGYHGTALLKALHMPWSQLTYLQLLDRLPAAVCRDILLHSSCLVMCSLCVEPWDFDDDIHDAAIATLPSLHSLDVAFDGSGHASSFFQPLTLPALRVFGLTHEDCDWSEPIFLQLQLRSSMCLESLRLNTVRDLASHELIHFLENIPSLMHLELTFLKCFDDILAEALCYNELDARPLVPNLQVLDVSADGSQWDDVNKDIIIETMIRSRWCSDADLARAPLRVARWKRVSVVFECRDISPTVRERLTECCEEGLDLYLGGMPKVDEHNFTAILD